MNSYFVYYNDKFQGPFTVEEIASLLRQHKITVQEYLYDLQFRCMFQIGEIEDFISFTPPSPSIIEPKDKYLIYKDNTILGPYSQEDIIGMLKTKKIIAFDYAILWGQNIWAQIKDIPSLKQYIIPPPDTKSINFIQDNNNSEIVNTIIRKDHIDNLELSPGIIRKHPRTPYSASASIFHNNNSYIGKCTTLAIGGCFIETQVTHFKLGDELTLKIKPDTIKIEINTHARITSINNEHPKGIGLQFLNLPVNLKKEIQEFVTRYINMIKKRKDKN